MKKLAAFTVMELLVGMIVAGIVVAFAYGAYSLVYRRYLGFNDMKQKINESVRLLRVFNSDIEKAENIFYQDNRFDFITANQPSKSYTYTDSIVVRESVGVKDTFLVTMRNVTVQRTSPDTDGLIRQISFEAQVLEENETFVIEKEHTASEFMNKEMQELFVTQEH